MIQLADGGDLGHLIRHEFLAAEARLHRHHQDQLHLIQIGQDRLRRGLGLQDDARPLALGVDLVDGGLDVLRRVRLHMDRHQIGAGVAELLHVPHRLHDHQVDVQGQLRDLADGLHHRDADGDVGDEHAVHHIHMDVVGVGDAVNVPLQIRKIGGEDGRSNFNHGEDLFPLSFRCFQRSTPEMWARGLPWQPGGGERIG